MIAYVGIDAHTTNYTLSTYLEGSAAPVNTNTYSPAVANIISYCKGIRKKVGNDTEIVVGYEAGCLGFKLKRDAEAIARSLKNHEYSEVYTPDEEDESIRDFIRMEQDHKKQLRVIKQQVCAFTTRHGYIYTDGRNYWAKKHLK